MPDCSGAPAFCSGTRRNCSGALAECIGAFRRCSGAMAECSSAPEDCSGAIRWCSGAIRFWSSAREHCSGAILERTTAFRHCTAAKLKCTGPPTLCRPSPAGWRSAPERHTAAAEPGGAAPARRTGSNPRAPGSFALARNDGEALARGAPSPSNDGCRRGHRIGPGAPSDPCSPPKMGGSVERSGRIGGPWWK